MWARHLVMDNPRRGARPARVARAAVSLLALLAALSAAACGFKSPPTAGPDADIDAPTNGSGDASVDSGIDAPPIAWLHPWQHRKQITLRASLIEAPGDGALIDFPVLVSVTDAQLAAAALSTGADIVFTSDDATTVLASEIESFTPATKQLIAWVKVPSLSATVDTKLYVYYGHTSPPTQTPNDVWTANYLGVWHLNQNPGSGTLNNVLDTTSANHDGTSRNMASNNLVSAQIGTGFSFAGNNDFLSFPQVDFGNTFTISMWVNFAGGSSVNTLIANSPSGRDTGGFRFFINTVNLSDRKLFFETGTNIPGSGRTAETNTNAIAIDTPTHVAAVVNRAATTARIYVNGVSAGVTTTVASGFQNNSDFEAARMEDGFLYFAGTLDEIEVAATTRPPEWLLTSVNNQSQPGNFHTFGTEEQEP